MIRQYRAQRQRGGPNPFGVGVIAIGSIFYIQDDGWWRDRHRGAPTWHSPWIVEAFLNGVMHAARRNHDTGQWEDLFPSGRSDMALVRSLRDGRRQQIAVRTLILHDDHGLTKGATPYPTMPNLQLYRQTSRLTYKECPCPTSLRPNPNQVPRRHSDAYKRGDLMSASN